MVENYDHIMYGDGMETLQLRADRRRVDRNKRTTHDLAFLRERHEEIINLHVLGMKDTDIATHLGLHLNTVNNAVNSTLGREKTALMRGARDAETIDVAKKMQEIIPKALKVYDDILSAEKGQGVPLSLQKSVADSVLKDFSGLAVPKKVVAISARLTPELIEEIKANGKNAARECGLVVDTVAEEIKEVANG